MRGHSLWSLTSQDSRGVSQAAGHVLTIAWARIIFAWARIIIAWARIIIAWPRISFLGDTHWSLRGHALVIAWASIIIACTWVRIIIARARINHFNFLYSWPFLVSLGHRTYALLWMAHVKTASRYSSSTTIGIAYFRFLKHMKYLEQYNPLKWLLIIKCPDLSYS